MAPGNAGGEKKEGGEEGAKGEGAVEANAGGTSGGIEGAENPEDEKFLEEDMGSVASSTKSLLKHLRMLRNALYENYSPPSVRNLKLNGRIVSTVLLTITIAWYVYSDTQYTQLKDNIQNVHSSKYRINSLTQIGANVRGLYSLNLGRITKQRGGKDYEQYLREGLSANILLLQEA